MNEISFFFKANFDFSSNAIPRQLFAIQKMFNITKKKEILLRRSWEMKFLKHFFEFFLSTSPEQNLWNLILKFQASNRRFSISNHFHRKILLKIYKIPNFDWKNMYIFLKDTQKTMRVLWRNLLFYQWLISNERGFMNNNFKIQKWAV